VDAALRWIDEFGDLDGDGLLEYHKRSPGGLDNQGWKDSWDGISFADGRLPSGPIALAEVQGYCYAALRGAAHLASFVRDPGLDAQVLLAESEALRERFNDVFWNDAASSFVVGIVDDDTPIDSVTTNPGHAIWCGVADSDLADRYLDRCLDELWTGWGLRTLSPTAAAFNPLSYHNGSVWPHDTALVIAGAAALGRHDAVEHLIDGSLDAAEHFGGRPPELFAGTDRTEFPSPIDYPNSCAPQAWASASILMNLRSSLRLAPPPSAGVAPVVGEQAGQALELASLSGLCAGGERYRLDVTTGTMSPITR
jgi:glycogen debranching enzyme